MILSHKSADSLMFCHNPPKPHPFVSPTFAAHTFTHKNA